MKWAILLTPWTAFVLTCAFETHNAFTTELPIRVMIVIGTLVTSAVYLMIAQPWQPDRPATSR